MPGERLTYEERQRIAAGLAARLSYAEIAHRLGRPRSTIIREVARNGGAHAYRANQAQQATKWRSRRRKPVPQPVAPAAGSRGGEPLARHEFEAGFAEMMTRTGVPAMMAKVLACLFTSETGSLTAAELVARLRVSPASVSKAVAWLEQRGLVGRERDGRRERYLIDDHVWYQAWLASVQSMAQWAEFAQRGADLFGAGTAAGARLHATSQFFQHLGHDMIQAAEHWRQTLSAR
ncbi:helix-turn-helix domain-containing protein [Amycolatopsis anabasis]|uniref:helix-turn-helix domain-containing protein n=1 Tax=Amycolatopsis anabasis TaxID=1840409 RepID=UPI00131A664F|nr:helix-turn-helix domain-containing protein [Amycolatopsis anabasis]